VSKYEKLKQQAQFFIEIGRDSEAFYNKNIRYIIKEKMQETTVKCLFTSIQEDYRKNALKMRK
jgi:hypothetical protein